AGEDRPGPGRAHAGGLERPGPFPLVMDERPGAPGCDRRAARRSRDRAGPCSSDPQQRGPAPGPAAEPGRPGSAGPGCRSGGGLYRGGGSRRASACCADGHRAAPLPLGGAPRPDRCDHRATRLLLPPLGERGAGHVSHGRPAPGWRRDPARDPRGRARHGPPAARGRPALHRCLCRIGRCPMNSFLGMDTAQVRAHVIRLRTASTEVHALRDHVTTALASTRWRGPDAQRFSDRWEQVATTGLGGLCQDLAALSDRIAGEAEEQDAASARGDRREPGPSPAPAPSETDDGSTYLHRDAPWVPDWLEGPLEGAASDLAGVVSEGIGRGVDAGMGGIAWAAGRLRLDTDGLEQIRGDLGHLGGLLGDWATGERVPTIAELGASALLAAGSAAIAPVELFTDTG